MLTNPSARPGAAAVPWVPSILGHAGPGATWQAMVTLLAVAVAVAVVLAAVGIVKLERADDLVLPLAAAVIAASLAPMGDAWLSDWIGWSLPLGIIALLVLLIAALTDVPLGPRSPLFLGAVAVTAVATLVLWRPLTIALHPPPEQLPPSADSEVTIEAPGEGETVAAGQVEVVVTVTGGSIGPGGVPLEELPADPEEAGALSVTLDGTRVEVTYDRDCTVSDPCSTVAFPVEVTAGERGLTVEFTRGDGTPLAPFVADRVTFTAQ